MRGRQPPQSYPFDLVQIPSTRRRIPRAAKTPPTPPKIMRHRPQEMLRNLFRTWRLSHAPTADFHCRGLSFAPTEGFATSQKLSPGRSLNQEIPWTQDIRNRCYGPRARRAASINRDQPQSANTPHGARHQSTGAPSRLNRRLSRHQLCLEMICPARTLQWILYALPTIGA